MGYTFSKKTKKQLQMHSSSKKENIQKSAASAIALLKLRSYLNASEPALVYFLVRTWKKQQKAVTYKELREALLNGTIDSAWLEQWQQDYAQFVVENLEPAWMDAMAVAAADIKAKYPDWNFDPYADGVRDWAERKAAEFVTNSTMTQIQALQAVVMRAAVLEDMTVDGLSRIIRPMVGLTHQQSIANLNYYNSLIKKGVSKKKAEELAIKYAAKQHRYRAYNIARTELAFAYNQGVYFGTKQAQEAGYMGEVVKVWSTADDERVCPLCGPMDGKEIPLDDDFDFKTKLAGPQNPTIRKAPPLHPSCRCTMYVKEISPPVIQNQ